ncbi:hypothetical protein ACA910_013821 [Epithemia clementina (nom. ined.)]
MKLFMNIVVSLLAISSINMVDSAGGDTCDNAVVIQIGESDSGSTLGSPPETTTSPFCGTSYDIETSVTWYQFVGNGNVIEVSLCGSSFDTKIHVFSCGCDEQRACVAGNDQSLDDSCGFSSSRVQFDTDSGRTFFIMVHGYENSSGDYNLSIVDTQEASFPNTTIVCPRRVDYSTELCSNSFSDISGTGTNLEIRDDEAGVIVDIGFSFLFYGVERNRVGVSSNGYMAFGPQRLTVFSETPIPDVSAPNDMIAVLWNDFDLTSSGDVYYQLDSPARFTVQWNEIPEVDVVGSSNTFQAIFLMGTNCIELRYGSFDTNDYVIGIEDSAGSQGIDATSEVQNGATCVRLCPPLGCDYPCGKNGDKVKVCHYPPGKQGKPKELCIGRDAVMVHLENHNDQCGPCPSG